MTLKELECLRDELQELAGQMSHETNSKERIQIVDRFCDVLQILTGELSRLW